jgi:hypothetical protein
MAVIAISMPYPSQKVPPDPSAFNPLWAQSSTPWKVCHAQGIFASQSRDIRRSDEKGTTTLWGLFSLFFWRRVRFVSNVWGFSVPHVAAFSVVGVGEKPSALWDQHFENPDHHVSRVGNPELFKQPCRASWHSANHLRYSGVMRLCNHVILPAKSGVYVSSDSPRIAMAMAIYGYLNPWTAPESR